MTLVPRSCCLVGSACDILEFQPGSSFAPSSGKGKRESARDDRLLLGTSDEEFVSPQVGLEALRQLGSCISAGPSAAVQAVVRAAASNVYLSLSGFLTLVGPHIVFVVVTSSAAAALKYCTAPVCLFLVSFTSFLSVFLAGRFHGTLVDNRFLELALSCIGHVPGLRIGRAAHGASVACDRLVRPPPLLPSPPPPRFGYYDDFAFAEAKASPRVDVDETPRFVTEVEHEGKSVKEPSVPEVFSVFVGSLLGPHLVWLHSCLFADIGSHGAHWGSWAHVQLRCGGKGGCQGTHFE